MDYVKRRIITSKKTVKKKRRSKKDFEFTQGDAKNIELLNELHSYRDQLAVMKKQLDNVSGKVEETDKIVPLDEKKLTKSVILNTDERERLEQKVKDCEDMLRSRETAMGEYSSAAGGTTECYIRNDKIDKRTTFRRLIRAKRALYYGTHGKLNSKDINKLVAEKKHIEKILRDTLPSISECNDPKKATNLSYYLEKHQKKYGHLMEKLKNVNKILEPDNPNAGSLRYLWKE